MISSCLTSYPMAQHMDKNTLTVVDVATGANVSWKSIPYCWVNPRATSLHLYRSIDPSAFFLILKTIFESTMFLPVGGSAHSYTSPCHFN